MHQSRMFSIHWRYSSPRRSGMKRSVPVAVRRERRLRRAAPSSRTTGPRAAAPPRFRSDSSGPPRGGDSRPSPAGPAPRDSATTRFRASNRSSPRKRSGHRVVHLARRVSSCRSAGELVARADLEVERVVRRRHLHGAGAELGSTASSATIGIAPVRRAAGRTVLPTSVA